MTMLNLSELLVGNIHFQDKNALAPLQRLSSGMKINYAADDPSGIALISTFKSAEYGLLKSIENAMDGISMIQTIDGYLSEISDMIMRMQELTITAANDAVLRDDCRDRARLNAELQELIAEIDRQAQIAYFNTKPILQGDLLADAEVRAGSDVTVVATGTASDPSWVDENTLVYTDAVYDTGAQTGSRPSSLGGSTTRVFTQDIDLLTNAASGGPTQQTDDPNVLVDTDGDGYFDRAAGRINDAVPGDPLYPFNDPDNDLDGYRATVDNNDNDNTETGTGLNSLAADIVVPITGTAYSQDFTTTWDNTVTRNFVGGTKVVDSVDVQANAGYTLQVQVLDNGTGAWVNAGASIVSTGAVQTVDFGADYTADAVRVVIDDPVAEVDAAHANVQITSPITNDVELDPIAANNPPDTYKYSITGVAQDIDTFELQVTNTVNYTIYADDGSGPTAVYTGTGTGLTETISLGSTINNPTDFYVELDAPGGTVSNFDAYLDTEHAGAFVASASPVTYKYTITGAAFDIDTIKAEVSSGANYDIFYDIGNGIPVSAEIVSNQAGTTGTLDTHAVATTAPTEFYIDLDAAGTVNQFYAESEVAIGVAAASTDRITYKVTIPGAPAAIDEIQVDTTDAHDVYVDGTFLASGAGGGVVSHAYAGPAATDVYIEMANPAGTINSIDTLNGGIPVGAGAAVQVDHVYEYNFAASDLNHLEIETTAGTGYEVFVDGASVGVGVGGSLEEFDFAMVAGATNIQIVMDVDATAADLTSVYAANRQAIGAQAAATRSTTYDLGAAQNFTHLDVQITSGVDYEIYDDTNALITSGTGTGNLEELVLAGNTSSFRIDVEVGASTADVLDFAVREETSPGVGAQSTETRFYRYDVQSNPQEASHIELDLSAAVSNVTITDSNGTTIYNGAAAAGVLSVDYTAASTDYFDIELSVGNTSAVINSFTVRNDVNLAGASNSFTDLTAAPNASNENVVTYTLDNTGGQGYLYFDQLDFDIEEGHPYLIEAFDGTSWTTVTSGTGVAGAEPTYYIENNGVTSEFTAQQIRITLLSGNDTEGGEATLTAVTNRIDRDGDNFPDVIEYMDGSDADDAADLPFGAVAGTGVPDGPDDDGDGYLDNTSLYDTFDDAANPPIGVNLNNPYNFTWTDASGNNLFAYSGKQLDPEDVPVTTDSDGDTIPNPLDPFDGQAEFTTWVDGAASMKGGTILFISNRDNATSGDQDVYILSGGTYYLASPASNNAAANPTLNDSGTAGAWDEGGMIYGFVQEGISCGVAGGVITFPTNPVAGTNPTFKGDTTEFAYEDGSGKIKFATIPDGNATRTDHDISGYNPDWNGDNIIYTTAAGESSIQIYNLVTMDVYDLGITGTNPTFQPTTNKDEIKVAYESGGTVHVVTVDLTYEPNYIQVGAYNEDSNRVSFSYPDARADQLGISSIAIDTQEGAMAALDVDANGDTVLDRALNAVSDYRAEIGQAELMLRQVVDDLYQQHINLAAARSNIEDADMASEYTELARNQILRNSAYATSAQASSVLEEDRLGAIRESVGVESIRRFLTR